MCSLLTPPLQRALVLHNCYVSTARAFARDSAIKHIDPDANNIVSPAKGLEGDPITRSIEDVLRSVGHRERELFFILLSP
jgi:hypothetical protein